MKPIYNRLVGLLLLAALSALILVAGGCAGPRERALHRAQRHARLATEALAPYPDLLDTLAISRRVDTLRLPAHTDSTRWALAQDTAAFFHQLEDYYQARLKQQATALPQGDGRADRIAPDRWILPGPVPVAAPEQRRQAVQAAQALSALRRQLSRGAFKDSTYQYQDGYLSATITTTGGIMQFRYTLRPRSLAYQSSQLFLRPAAATPEECQPRRFWQDWLFWVALGLLVAIRVFGQALIHRLMGVIPRF